MKIKDFKKVQSGELDETEMSDVMWITDDNGNCFLRITDNGDGSFTIGCFGVGIYNDKIYIDKLSIDPVSSDSIVVCRKEHTEADND